METHEEHNYQEVIRQAAHCAVVYDTDGQAQHNTEPTRVVDMATTGAIPEGYTHLVFVEIDSMGYVVSCNLEGQYKVEIRDRIVS